MGVHGYKRMSDVEAPSFVGQESTIADMLQSFEYREKVYFYQKVSLSRKPTRSSYIPINSPDSSDMH